MCFLSTTFPNAPAHPAPILFDQSLIFDIVFSLIRYFIINLLNGDEKSKLRKTDYKKASEYSRIIVVQPVFKQTQSVSVVAFSFFHWNGIFVL